MILHDGYLTLADDYKVIKDQLELQETVETLQRTTGQTPDRYSGIVQAVRPPQVNYLISHGVVGMVVDWSPATLADQLVNRRGLQSNDLICLITCMAGEPGGDAEKLARELGARGALGVRIRATEHYINWNSGGPLLLKSYVTDDQQVALAKAAWTDAEDGALGKFVANHKAVASAAIDTAFSAAPKVAVDLVLDFVRARPPENTKALTGLVDKAQKVTGGDQQKALKAIISQITAVKVYSGKTLLRDSTYARFAGELQGLIRALHIKTAPDSGAAAAEDEINKIRAALRKALADAWPAYSAGYFDRLRTITTGPQATQQGMAQAGAWTEFISAAPPPVQQQVQQPVVTQPAPLVNEVLTDQQIEDLLRELGIT